MTMAHFPDTGNSTPNLPTNSTMKYLATLKLIPVLLVFAASLVKAEEEDVTLLLQDLHNSNLPVQRRIAVAEALARMIDKHPSIASELCKEIGMPSPEPIVSGAKSNPNTGTIYPISRILAQAGPSAFTAVLEAWLNEPFPNANILLSLPLLSIMENHPSTKALWLERFANETDDAKRERLREFGRDILLIKEFPAPKAATSPENKGTQNEPPSISVPKDHPSVRSLASPKTPDVQPITTIQKPSSSTAWGIAIVATIGLLWLLLRKRK